VTAARGYQPYGDVLSATGSGASIYGFAARAAGWDGDGAGASQAEVLRAIHPAPVVGHAERSAPAVAASWTFRWPAPGRETGSPAALPTRTDRLRRRSGGKHRRRRNDLVVRARRDERARPSAVIHPYGFRAPEAARHDLPPSVLSPPSLAGQAAVWLLSRWVRHASGKPGIPSPPNPG
jgi:hypothetical protein